MLKKVEEGRISRKMKMAPAPGFEPGTKWLTATYSTAELCRSMNKSFSMFLNIYSFLKKANKKYLLLLFFVFVFNLVVRIASPEQYPSYPQST